MTKHFDISLCTWAHLYIVEGKDFPVTILYVISVFGQAGDDYDVVAAIDLLAGNFKRKRSFFPSRDSEDS